MFKCLQYHILFSFILLLPISTCFSDETAIYCHGELSRDPYRRTGDIFLREFVIPERGPYYRHFVSEKSASLSTTEKEILHSIKLKLSLSPVYIAPFLIQTSIQKDSNGLNHVEALCIILQEMIIPPFIDPILSEFEKKSIDFNDLSKFARLRHLELYSFDVDNLAFPDISKLSGLEYLGLPYKTRDQHLKHVSSLKKLKFVNASGTKIKGNGLQYLSALPELRILDLRYTSLEPGSLTMIKSSPSLETILISHTNIRDEDLRALTSLKTLKYITLHQTSVTDEGLKILSQLNNLKYVSLYDTPTKKSGQQALLRAHPGLVIDTEQPQKLDEFLADRKIILAWIGDKPTQFDLSMEYSDKYRKQPKDLIESLKWLFILAARKGEKTKRDVTERSINVPMKEIIEQLDESQIAEARRRARVYLYIHNKSDFRLEIERKKGLPLYQYAFPSNYGVLISHYSKQFDDSQ